MTLTSRVSWILVLAALLPACGGDDDENEDTDDTQGIDMLDPTAEHYGKSYEEWAGAWIQYVNSVSPPECASPIMDTTGESCALYQDPDSDVFMLAGNYGGVSIRDACVVPAGKALLVPILEISGDNAGVPEDALFSDAELKDFVESNFDLIDVASVHLSVDGHPVHDLERGAIRSTPYTIDLPPGMNVYVCQAAPEVEGEFSGYVGGYWALFPPLEAGAHTIAFGGTESAAPQGQEVTVDVTYELIVE